MSNIKQLFQGGFDSSTVEPDAGRDFELIPQNTVLDFEITKSEIKDASTGNGCFLALELTVMGPEYAGRKIWKNITLKNTNDKAEQIGQAQLSALCRAVGIGVLEDSDDLFQKMFRGRVVIEKGRPKDKSNPSGEKYDDKNDIGAFEPLGSAPAASPAPARQAAAPAPAAKPWAKRA